MPSSLIHRKFGISPPLKNIDTSSAAPMKPRNASLRCASAKPAMPHRMTVSTVFSTV